MRAAHSVRFVVASEVAKVGMSVQRALRGTRSWTADGAARTAWDDGPKASLLRKQLLHRRSCEADPECLDWGMSSRYSTACVAQRGGKRSLDRRSHMVSWIHYLDDRTST